MLFLIQKRYFCYQIKYQSMNHTPLTKFLVIIALLLNLENQAIGQYFNLGFRFGPTTTDFYDRERPPSANFLGIPTLGMTVGVLGELELSHWLKFQIEFNTTWEGHQGHFWNRYDANLWYMTMPALLKMHVYKSLWLGGGFEANYLLDVTGSSDNHSPHRWTAAFVFQVEHVFLKRFSCSIRYIHGFTPTHIINYVDYEGNPNSVSTYSGRSLQVTLSYIFKKNRINFKPTRY